MTGRLLALALATATMVATAPAQAAPVPKAALPDQLKPAEESAWRAVFARIRDQKWADAAAAIDGLGDGALKPYARAELYLAKGSPEASAEQLVALIAEAPELPQAERLAALARARGASVIPAVPQPQRLTWLGSKPQRARAASVRSDPAGAALSGRIMPLIKDNRPEEAERLIDATAGSLTPEALTEWQQRVAWSYYLTGNDHAARMLAAKARRGAGEWAVQAEWVIGLASWRQREWIAAAEAFRLVAANAGDEELRSAGYFWLARAEQAAGRPQLAQPALRSASAFGETFYGQLAIERLGLAPPRPINPGEFIAADWKTLAVKPNIPRVAALAEIGEMDAADDLLRHQARIGNAGDHEALVHLAARLSLPATQLWLAHNGPPGARPSVMARYPAPDWRPDGGWRVDKALVFAHALQESNFRATVVSPAGARGLMQVMPATAAMLARQKGVTLASGDLNRPSTNMEYGQSFLEAMRDRGETAGLLPKVIASYNAGPGAVAKWNDWQRDRGDPLLYIESISYWETRGYVVSVLRNYWMYQQQAGEKSPSREALAQGLWPRFPGLPGSTAVRIDLTGRGQGAD